MTESSTISCGILSFYFPIFYFLCSYSEKLHFHLLIFYIPIGNFLRFIECLFRIFFLNALTDKIISFFISLETPSCKSISSCSHTTYCLFKSGLYFSYGGLPLPKVCIRTFVSWILCLPSSIIILLIW